MNRIGLIYRQSFLLHFRFRGDGESRSDQDEIIRRLDRLEQAHARLEQENAALRTSSTASTAEPRRVPRRKRNSAIRRSRQPYVAVKAPVNSSGMQHVRRGLLHRARHRCLHQIGGYLRLQGSSGGSGEGAPTIWQRKAEHGSTPAW
jgi:hypothetical protein